MGLGPMHLFIIAVVVLLLFGNRLPQVMRSLGEGITEFKKGIAGIEEKPKPRLPYEDDKTIDEPK